MVVSDINILCIGQLCKFCYKHPDIVMDIVKVDPSNQTTVYKDRYLELNNVTGIWYHLYPRARLAGDYTSEFFDLKCNGSWNEILFEDKYVKLMLVDCISAMYSDISVKEICFFVDLQGYQERTQHLSLGEFCDKLTHEQLLFNTIYHISKY